ncbi:MAG: site-2 protease family protein [Candidatus Omnitrophica bacterium]|nr:site-2 protease family protein [Candidatus Omnitrophota bacterium]
MIEIILVIAFALGPAIILHEYAHGWAANLLGDPTAKLAGRLTLNPIKHIDPVGSILLPGSFLLAYFMGWTQSLFLFGWAKPVPVNFMRLKSPRRDMMIVAAAGPLTNIFLALAGAQIFRAGLLSGILENILIWAIELNLVLAVFNMIPIPPLDGSRIVSGFLPARMAYAYNQLERYGIVIVLVLLQVGLFRFIHPIVDALMAILGVNI